MNGLSQDALDKLHKMTQPGETIFDVINRLVEQVWCRSSAERDPADCKDTVDVLEGD